MCRKESKNSLTGLPPWFTSMEKLARLIQLNLFIEIEYKKKERQKLINHHHPHQQQGSLLFHFKIIVFV